MVISETAVEISKALMIIGGGPANASSSMCRSRRDDQHLRLIRFSARGRIRLLL
jgi:hypothetical protein